MFIQEFETWLRELKNVEAGSLPKRETMEFFATYAEDYNTCTLPHEKWVLEYLIFDAIFDDDFHPPRSGITI